MPNYSMRWRNLVPVVAGLMLTWVADPAAADCSGLQTQAGAAQRDGNLAGLKAVFDQVVVTPDCPESVRGQLGLAVARATEKRVYQAAQAGRPLAPFEAELSESLRYARLWRVLAWLGDIARDRKDYAGAAKSYQEALAVIQDEQATPTAPPPDVIEAIFKRAEQARLLAPQYVAAPKTRAGGLSGLGARDIRGYTPRSVSVPIEFVTGSVDFTPKGWQAAQELLSQVLADGPSRISLIGHTDPRGDSAYNVRLSLERAKAVGNFLRANGYDGDVWVEGKGESEPLAVDPEAVYSVAELYQMQRRVELRR